MAIEYLFNLDQARFVSIVDRAHFVNMVKVIELSGFEFESWHEQHSDSPVRPSCHGRFLARADSGVGQSF